MKKIIPLCDTAPGNKCRIIEVISKGKKRNRLLDLGLIKNNEIDVLYSSPFGNPVAYYVQGAVIALRREDACEITVEII